jgi:hypothetical protein
MIVQLAILKLSGGQSVEPGRVLVQEAPRLKMQLTAEQFAYRAFHAREIRIIDLQLASPTVIFLRTKMPPIALNSAVYDSVPLAESAVPIGTGGRARFFGGRGAEQRVAVRERGDACRHRARHRIDVFLGDGDGHRRLRD